MKLRIYITLIFLSFLSTACIDELDTETNIKEYQVVINCLFSPDSYFKAFITKSYNPYGINDEFYVEDSILNAEVKIFENNRFLCNLTHFYGEIYSNNLYYPKEGNFYQIEVSVGNKKISASSYVPEKVPITMITIDTSYFDEYGTFHSDGIPHYQLHFDDPIGINNYLLSVYCYNKTIFFNDTIVPVHYLSNDPVIGDYDSEYNDNETFFIFSDVIYNGKPYILDFVINPYRSFEYVYGSVNELPITVLLSSVSTDFAAYTRSFSEYTKTKDNPLAEPTSIYTNIEGGLGIFAGYNSSKEIVIIMRK